MKVLTTTSMFPSPANRMRGISVWQRTRALARLCEVRVIAPSMDGAVAPREVVEGIEVLHPRWIRVPKMVVLNGYLFGWLAKRAAAGLGGFEPDVIDAHFVYPDGFGAVRLGRALGKPVCLSARGTDVNDLCFRWPIRGLARRALRAADQLVAVSQALRDRMIEAGAPAGRIAVVPNGVDTALFHPGDRAAARSALGVPEDAVALFSAGGLIEQKGYQDLIAGLARLSDRPDLWLYIAGDGPREAALRRAAAVAGLADRVVFLGRLAPGAMAEWYRAADLFCFGSWREGCPNVVIEALASGLPVVATRVGGVPELVADERCGVLFEARSPEAFAAALRVALGRDWDRGHVAALGSARSWERVAEDVHAVLEQTLARRKATA